MEKNTKVPALEQFDIELLRIVDGKEMSTWSIHSTAKAHIPPGPSYQMVTLHLMKLKAAGFVSYVHDSSTFKKTNIWSLTKEGVRILQKCTASKK